MNEPSGSQGISSAHETADGYFGVWQMSRIGLKMGRN